MQQSGHDTDIAPNPNVIEIAIVGGGIAGLYCGYLLGKRAVIFESTDQLGGRILTKRVHQREKDNSAANINFDEDSPLEFYAEFGPMRIEPDQQAILSELLGVKHLDIKERHGAEPAGLVNFPAYVSSIDEHQPRYDLRGEEQDAETPLDLMKLAFIRLLGRLKAISSPTEVQPEIIDIHRQELEYVLDLGTRALMLATSSHQPDWRGTLQSWIDSLQEGDYQNLREYGHFEGVLPGGASIPLYEMGFWNLLSEVLSHDAVMKLRDLGTFYHLLPENPNAAEWVIFWLRALKTSKHLKGIYPGMDVIVNRIKQRLNAEIKTNHELVNIKPEASNVMLGFKNGSSFLAKHVIFALPKAPLEKLAISNQTNFPPKILEEIDSVFGFPMIKIFVVVKQRWWEEDHRANRYATRIPTRELHYWKSEQTNSKRGMILIYTDRPASSFWANYVTKSGRQDMPEWGRGSDNPRLISRIIEYLQQIGVSTIHEDDVEYYGIRDWGRGPYEGANHAWRPERQSWQILKNLSGFALEGSNIENIHICGEAYSDYHGFIEGALRSAAHVLHKIDSIFETPTFWLCKCDECVKQESRGRRSSYK